jgi:hypothetical protein
MTLERFCITLRHNGMTLRLCSSILKILYLNTLLNAPDDTMKYKACKKRYKTVGMVFKCEATDLEDFYSTLKLIGTVYFF